MVTEIKTQFKFPSEEFFRALVKVTNEALSDKSLGFAVLKMGFEVIGLDFVKRYVINFDGYEVNYEGETDDFDILQTEAYVTGQLSVYLDMFKNIQENSKATGPNTFNALTMAGFPLNIQGKDQVATDKVFRFAETIQQFLDSAAFLGEIIS